MEMFVVYIDPKYTEVFYDHFRSGVEDVEKKEHKDIGSTLDVVTDDNVKHPFKEFDNLYHKDEVHLHDDKEIDNNHKKANEAMHELNLFRGLKEFSHVKNHEQHSDED